MRAIWKGSIAFGLVNIPINVYPASEEHTLEFHMLHKDDLSPVRFARICKQDGKEIPYTDIVKGYEYEKGEYVVISDEEFKSADPKKTSTIEIQQFTNSDEIPVIYYEKPYFLEPDKKSQKAYLLLYHALLSSKKVAIANYVFRNREHIGVILPLPEGGLVLMQMRYQNEIRPLDKLEIPKGKVSKEEAKMALALIDQLSKAFDPEKYHDTYVDSLMLAIEEKLKGKKPKRKAKKEKVSKEVRDVMGLLQESLKHSLSQETTKKKKTHYEPKKVRQQKKSGRISRT